MGCYWSPPRAHNATQLPLETLAIQPMTGKCWASVVGGAPTLNQHWFNVSCLQGRCVLTMLGYGRASAVDVGTTSASHVCLEPNTKCSIIAGLMLGHRLRRWPNIKPTMIMAVNPTRSHVIPYKYYNTGTKM